ncbi:macrolide ABC transporter ATP-binding protein [Peptoniphilus lacrimalis DNF00528]|uniref:ABC transporter, ATP-binding protein n=1 Tax=Peptoniphilus lacrimalis 315-B TaxID=596330 RepID=D1VT25_9FIRM|nr:ABC transporter ATP-binding protein [Peptoniphilus lacrimalis]EFA90307.1 ABC transporter, ATP-binding protein [Peptoniphilus lacrimalis 315-B]KGF31326.1 macrolide ABC transporter ATP-binding protein [Peptoniphilus lacrimalis DNF00528]
MAFIEVINMSKVYKAGETSIVANDSLTFHIEKNEFAIILGPSGAGKSTFLNILGGMDKPTDGEIIVDGKEISKYTDRELTTYRRNVMAFVFQFYNLIPNLTALENVELATQIVKNAKDPLEVLKSVGLENRINNFPSQLSGGEQQRVSIARAISKNPKLLLCDEPTGALDYKTGKQILTLLQDLTRNTDTTVVVITHNSAIAPCADRVIEITDAKVKNISINKEPKKISQIEW